jgi:hypothetical protein
MNGARDLVHAAQDIAEGHCSTKALLRETSEDGQRCGALLPRHPIRVTLAAFLNGEEPCEQLSSAAP